jgi:hypothetical protein
VDYVASQGRQRLQAVDGRRLEVHGARILVVLADCRHLTDLETEGGGLDQHLSVKHEVVAVLEEGNRLEKSARVSAVAGVILLEIILLKEFF